MLPKRIRRKLAANGHIFHGLREANEMPFAENSLRNQCNPRSMYGQQRLSLDVCKASTRFLNRGVAPDHRKAGHFHVSRRNGGPPVERWQLERVTARNGSHSGVAVTRLGCRFGVWVQFGNFDAVCYLKYRNRLRP